MPRAALRSGCLPARGATPLRGPHVESPGIHHVGGARRHGLGRRRCGAAGHRRAAQDRAERQGAIGRAVRGAGVLFRRRRRPRRVHQRRRTVSDRRPGVRPRRAPQSHQRRPRRGAQGRSRADPGGQAPDLRAAASEVQRDRVHRRRLPVLPPVPQADRRVQPTRHCRRVRAVSADDPPGRGQEGGDGVVLEGSQRRLHRGDERREPAAEDLRQSGGRAHHHRHGHGGRGYAGDLHRRRRATGRLPAAAAVGATAGGTGGAQGRRAVNQCRRRAVYPRRFDRTPGLPMPKKLLSVLALLAIAGAAHAADEGEKKARDAIHSLLPLAVIDRVVRSDLPGFYEVIISGQIAYVSSDGKYLLQGNLYDVPEKKDLTAARLAQLRAEALAQLPAAKRIVFAPPHPKYSVTVFTDVDCPYCRQFHKQIAEYNQLGIAVEYVLFPLTIHPGADKKAVTVWCAKDRNEAYTEAMNGVNLPPKTCANPVAELTTIAMAMGVEGTPAIFTADGVQLGGYLPPQQLAQRLEELAAHKVAAQCTNAAGARSIRAGSIDRRDCPCRRSGCPFSPCWP